MRECGCNKISDNSSKDHKTIISWNDLNNLHKKSENNLMKKLSKNMPAVTNDIVQTFDNGYCVVSSAAIVSEKHVSEAFVSGSSVIDNVPFDFVLKYDLTSLSRPYSTEPKPENVVWINLEITNPVKRLVKIPMKPTNVICDSSGHIIKFGGLELVTSLVSDVGEALKIIACFLACVGLTCVWECWGLCAINPVTCAACLIACAGANAAAVSLCIAACREALGMIEGSISS